jgi:hypothetical protein
MKVIVDTPRITKKKWLSEQALLVLKIKEFKAPQQMVGDVNSTKLFTDVKKWQ